MSIDISFQINEVDLTLNPFLTYAFFGLVKRAGQEGMMTEVIADPKSLTKDEAWRELIRVFAETALFGKEITASDLDKLLDPGTSGSITHETKLIGYSVDLGDGLKGDADSLDVTEAIMAIEEAFDITIDEGALGDIENAGGVLALVWEILHPEDATA